MITVAVIGCGYWGPNIIRNLVENHNCVLRYCCDNNHERLGKITSQYPEVELTADTEQVFKDANVDAVFVATPLATHYKLVKQALKSGKAVFVEKPFVEEAKKGEELVNLAESQKLPLMVGHIFEYSPPVIKIKEFIDNNEIGKIYYIASTRVNLGIHRRDSSVIWDLASHDLSTLFYWLEEEPISIQAVAKGSIIKSMPDIAFISLKFPSDILVNLQVSWLAPIKLRTTVIVGSEKMIVFDDTSSLEKVRLFDKGVASLEHSTFGEFQLSYRTGEMTAPFIPNVEPLKEEISHFFDCIQRKKKPRTDGEWGLKVVKYLELADKSIKKGGKIIYVNNFLSH